MKVCPKCGSKSVYKVESLQYHEDLFFEGRFKTLSCTVCDYQEPLKVESIRFRREKREIVKEHYGIQTRKYLRDISFFRKLKSRSLSLLGEAPKGVYVCTSSKDWYLLKWPKKRDKNFTHGYREIVTEALMTEIVSKFTKAALCKVVVYRDTPVLISKIFTKKGVTDQLVHGVELFKAIYEDEEGIDKIQQNRDAQREFYSFHHVCEAINEYVDSEPDKIRASFCQMLLADALVGNQDRHAENWGVITKKGVGESRVGADLKFAPVFDTARGLLWNCHYGNLAKYKNSEELAKYAESSLPLIGLEGIDKANHFLLAGEIKKCYPVCFAQFEERLFGLDLGKVLQRFNRFLSPLRIKLIRELLEYRKTRLLRL